MLQDASVVIDETPIATITMKLAGASVNIVGPAYVAALHAALDVALGHAGLRGIILTSGHRDFCAGADLDQVYGATAAAPLRASVAAFLALLRRLETCGVPVVAALSGPALGGGYEVALACHHRIALQDSAVQVGLPEVGLGVIPGGGGSQRLPRLIGIQAALEAITSGALYRPAKALQVGLVDALAADGAALQAQARAWILAHPDARQPWDRGAPIPGVQPDSTAGRELFIAAAGLVHQKTAGAYPAVHEAVRVVHEGLKLRSLEAATTVETRAFVRLVLSGQAKDMIRTLFFHKGAADRQVGLPRPSAGSHGVGRVAVLGAGMMGAGLAFLCARAGCSVVVRDIQPAALAQAQRRLDAQIEGLRHLSAAERAALAARITLTLDVQAVAGADLVIEAVVEDLGVKHAVIREVEPLLAPGAVFASNTSAIPIAQLAAASQAPGRFIGMHFFSPVERMPLLEVIQPPGTETETLARVLALGRALGKTCIVVNDGEGFYTTRLFAAYLLEGCQLVAEGHAPALVEWAAQSAGMAMPPLKVFDEVSLTLGLKALRGRAAVSGAAIPAEGLALVQALVEAHGRTGRAGGAGFYDWQTRRLWPGLASLVSARAPTEAEGGGLAAVQRRLMLAQVAEVGRVLDDGIIRQHRDADVGAVLGLGFAPNTGGPLAWMDRQGLAALTAEMDRTAARHGVRYAPSATLRRMAADGVSFYGDFSPRSASAASTSGSRSPLSK